MLGKINNRFESWANKHTFKLVIFLLFIMFMILLRSAGYFHPYYLISVDFIVIVSTITAIFVLGVGREIIILMLLITWLSVSVMYLLGVEIWAETTTIYTYELLIIDLFLQVFNVLRSRESDN